VAPGRRDVRMAWALDPTVSRPVAASGSKESPVGLEATRGRKPVCPRRTKTSRPDAAFHTSVRRTAGAPGSWAFVGLSSGRSPLHLWEEKTRSAGKGDRPSARRKRVERNSFR